MLPTNSCIWQNSSSNSSTPSTESAPQEIHADADTKGNSSRHAVQFPFKCLQFVDVIAYAFGDALYPYHIRAERCQFFSN